MSTVPPLPTFLPLDVPTQRAHEQLQKTMKVWAADPATDFEAVATRRLKYAIESLDIVDRFRPNEESKMNEAKTPEPIDELNEQLREVEDYLAARFHVPAAVVLVPGAVSVVLAWGKWGHEWALTIRRTGNEQKLLSSSKADRVRAAMKLGALHHALEEAEKAIANETANAIAAVRAYLADPKPLVGVADAGPTPAQVEVMPMRMDDVSFGDPPKPPVDGIYLERAKTLLGVFQKYGGSIDGRAMTLAAELKRAYSEGETYGRSID